MLRIIPLLLLLALAAGYLEFKPGPDLPALPGLHDLPGLGDVLGSGDAKSHGALKAGSAHPAHVEHTVDGDTVVVNVAGHEERVRYIGVDTPESVKPGVPVQCYAEAASHFNERMVEDRDVTLVVGAEPRDRYGRLLAYVYVRPDRLFVNAELLRRGYARQLTIAPNDRFASRFHTLARRARRAGRGLWSACPR